jgi:predicted nucleic acid-binding protein
VILYLDASALGKRYVAEPGTAEVEAQVRRAEASATALISRAEGAAALARAVRARVLDEGGGAR